MRTLTLIFTALSITSFAQKIKYKDVFGLLSTRQYEAAEPFLKKYLLENNDNPNAFLYMGIIYQEKSSKEDILRNTQEGLNHMDSAIYYFGMAHKTIDEKELKRNKDYYAMYFRRDLRTGEYGVKLSDVQFELERNMASLKERIDKVKMVKHYFTMSQQLYKRSNELFVSIQRAFPGVRELYLRADENTLKDLSTLSVRFDSCTKAFEHYKISLSNIQKSGYNQTWELIEIKEFKKDGIFVADFHESNLQIWDYKKFASEVVTVVVKEINPIREKLVRYDIEINKLKDRLVSDSISVMSDLTKLVDNLLTEKLQKYDENPFPLKVLGLKVAKLEYQSTLVETQKAKDSVNVFFKLKRVREEIKYLKKVDSLLTGLAKVNVDEEALNYQDFISSTYSSTALLKGYLKTERDFTDREMRLKNAELSLRSKALHWLIAGNDSIPLDLTYMKSPFKPLLVEADKYTAGIKVSDSLNKDGYFYSITPSRRPDIQVNFPIDKEHLNTSNPSSLKAIATADDGNSIHFVLLYSTVKVDEKVPITIAKIYRSDGLSWSKNFMLDFIPVTIQYLQDSTDLLVKSDSEQVILLDKTGSVRQ